MRNGILINIPKVLEHSPHIQPIFRCKIQHLQMTDQYTYLYRIPLKKAYYNTSTYTLFPLIQPNIVLNSKHDELIIPAFCFGKFFKRLFIFHLIKYIILQFKK